MIRIVIYFQIGQTDGQQVDEKMFSITSHQGNANQNHNEYYFTPVRLAKKQELTSVGKDVKKITHTLFTAM